MAVTTALGGWPSVFRSVGTIASETTEWIERDFGDLGETIKTVWNGVSKAISGGHIEAAFKIVTAGLDVAWLQMIEGLKKSWAGFSGWIAKRGK